MKFHKFRSPRKIFRAAIPYRSPFMTTTKNPIPPADPSAGAAILRQPRSDGYHKIDRAIQIAAVHSNIYRTTLRLCGLFANKMFRELLAECSQCMFILKAKNTVP